MEDYNLFNMFDYGADPSNVGDPSLGTNVNYATAGGSGVENFAPGQTPFTFLNAGSNYADTGGVKSAAVGSDLYNQLMADARTRDQQGILKIAALVGGGAALGSTAWGSAAPGAQYGSGVASASNAAFGSAAPAGAAEAPISLFGAGGAPSTLSGLGGGGLSSLNAGLAGAVNAGTAGLTAGMGGAAAGGAGGALAGLGGGGSSAAGGGLLSGLPGGAGTAAAGGGLLTGLAGDAGAAGASGGTSWWQNILNGLGGQSGNLGSNIQAGLTGAGLLTSLLGGSNSLSDMLGLTGANASSFKGVNTQGPGGSSSTYNPDTNTITGNLGNLTGFQGQLANYAGTQLANADPTAQRQQVLDLLRQQSAPQTGRAWNTLNNSLFSRGQLGGESTATGEAYRGFNEAENQADLGRQLAAFQFGQQGSQQAFNQANQAGVTAAGLQNNAFAPTLASMTPQTPGATSSTYDLLNQFLTGIKKP